MQNISFRENISAPIEKGTIIGEATFSVENEIVKKVNVVASESVGKLNLVNMTTTLFNDWFKLMR